jgi:hypothetical protein
VQVIDDYVIVKLNFTVFLTMLYIVSTVFGNLLCWLQLAVLKVLSSCLCSAIREPRVNILQRQKSK